MRAWIAVLVLLAGLAACSGSGSNRGETGAAPGSTAVDCVPTSGEVPQGSASAPTGAGSSVKLGPSASITAEEAAREASHRRGTSLILTGTVYAGDCSAPAAGAVINVWQTDARGVYGPGHGTESLRCCYLQGTLKTDAEGRYTIQTIKPGHYRGDDPPPPAHIHLEVHYRDAGLLTEVFFAGDPYLGAGEEGPDVIELQEETAPEGEGLTGRFDIVLGAAEIG